MTEKLQYAQDKRNAKVTASAVVDVQFPQPFLHSPTHSSPSLFFRARTSKSPVVLSFSSRVGRFASAERRIGHSNRGCAPPAQTAGARAAAPRAPRAGTRAHLRAADGSASPQWDPGPPAAPHQPRQFARRVGRGRGEEAGQRRCCRGRRRRESHDVGDRQAARAATWARVATESHR